VTVVPTGTVSAAGANAKLVILTAFGPAAADGAAEEPVALGGAADALAVPPPVIPGVVRAPDPKFTDGGP